MEEGSGMNLGGCVKNVKRNAVSLTRVVKKIYFTASVASDWFPRFNFHTASHILPSFTMKTKLMKNLEPSIPFFARNSKTPPLHCLPLPF